MAINAIRQDLNKLANGENGKSKQLENPRGVLDKDAFMKLLLVELQYQDPTEPMDSEKILSQTSQLASLESANNTNKAMEKLMERLSSTMDMGSLAAIGKMASLGSNTVALPENGLVNFEIYFPEKIKDGKLTISNSKGDIVREISLSNQVGKKDTLLFDWDGRNNSDERLPEGRYTIKSEYLDINNKQQTTQFGIYPVESVRYDNGKPMMKLGSSYVPMEKIVEFF